MSCDCVVIGAGVSGLTTAIILAQNGQNVALVEQAPKTAPLLRGFQRGGVWFDTGFHYAGGLGRGEILDRFCRYLGLADELEPVPFAAEAFDRCRGEEGDDFHFPWGGGRLRDALLSAFPAEGEAVDGYLQAVDAACARLPYLNLEADFGALAALGQAHGPTLQEVLDRLGATPRLQRLLSLHTLLHGVPPAQVPFTQHAAVVGPYYRSAHGLRGGGAALAGALEKRARRLGVELHLGRGAERIVTSAAGGLAGVQLAGGEHLACRSCVCTVHPSRFLELTPPELWRPAYRHRLAALEETVSAHLLFLVAEAPLPLLQGSNLYLAGAAHGPLTLTGVPLAQRPLYVSAASAGCDSMGLGVTAICPASFDEVGTWQNSTRGRRPAAYRQCKAEVAGHLIERLDAACPELRGRLRLVDSATPLTLSDYLCSPGGGLYGAKHRVGQYNPQSATRLPGLLLAGQAVAAPGVLGAMLSGFLACGSLLGHEQLRKDVQRCH